MLSTLELTMAVKQAKNLGRLELLAWLNDLAETDYPKQERPCVEFEN